MKNKVTRMAKSPAQLEGTKAHTWRYTPINKVPNIFFDKKTIWKWIFLLLASYTLVTIFHSHSVVSEMETRGSMRMVSPTLGAFYGIGNRDRISLMLFQDEDLETFGEHAWPAKYVFHADNIRALAALKPRAIFIDLMFVDRREDDLVPLVEAMCQAKGAGIKLYLASPSDGSSLGTVLTEITQSGCATLVTVPRLDDQFDQMIWEYGPETGNNRKRATAATQIARDFGMKDLPEEGEKLAIIWGTETALYNLQTLPKSFCAESTFMQGVKTSIPLIFEEKKPYCPFHALVRVSDIRLNASDAQIANTVKGRTVIYGSNMAGSADKVNTALNKKLPGPFVHAMALDNLLTYGGDWKRSGHYSFIPHELSSAFLIVALFLVCGLQVLVGNKNVIKEIILSKFRFARHLDLDSRIEALQDTMESAHVNDLKLQGLSIFRKTSYAIGGLLLRGLIVLAVFVFALPGAFAVAYFAHSFFSLAPSMWVTIAFFPPLLENFEVFEHWIQPVIDDFNGQKSEDQ